MAQTIEKIINKNVLKICFTLTFILTSALMFVRGVFMNHALSYFFYAERSYDYEVKETLFEIFLLNFGMPVYQAVKIMVIIAAIAGIVFTWLDKYKISCACAGVLVIIMLLSLLRLYDYDHYYVLTGTYEKIFYTYETTILYYILWALLIVLIALAILSIKNSKNSSKEVKTNTVIEDITQISPADEIKKYKELLDSGVITQEEFEAKKKSILE